MTSQGRWWGVISYKYTEGMHTLMVIVLVCLSGILYTKRRRSLKYSGNIAYINLLVVWKAQETGKRTYIIRYVLSHTWTLSRAFLVTELHLQWARGNPLTVINVLSEYTCYIQSITALYDRRYYSIMYEIATCMSSDYIFFF